MKDEFQKPRIAEIQSSVAAHLTGVSAPEVDAGSEPHCQNVVGGPVYEVEVEVVLQRGGIKNLHIESGMRQIRKKIGRFLKFSELVEAWNAVKPSLKHQKPYPKSDTSVVFVLQADLAGEQGRILQCEER